MGVSWEEAGYIRRVCYSLASAFRCERSFLLLLVRSLRNNRVRLEPFLDQHCAFSDDFEPMLRGRKHCSFSTKILVGNDVVCCDHQSQYDGKGSKF
jgi:hypothetical protein